MEIEEDLMGMGVTVTLFEGDNLADIPASHAHLLSVPLREAFAEPVARFRAIADECPFPEMARWLNILLEAPRWSLELNLSDDDEYSTAGFNWESDTVRSAVIGLPTSLPEHLPATLTRYYSLVDRVDWMGFSCAGNLWGANQHVPLTEIREADEGAELQPEQCFIWGDSPCGDLIIWTMDGRGGWASHESNAFQFLGSIEDSINWIFGQLCNNVCPEYKPDAE